MGFVCMQFSCVMHALHYMHACLHPAAPVHVSLQIDVSNFRPHDFTFLFTANPRLWPKIHRESSLSLGLLGGQLLKGRDTGEGGVAYKGNEDRWEESYKNRGDGRTRGRCRTQGVIQVKEAEGKRGSDTHR